MESAAKSVGLKLAHKLSREHVYLTLYSRMRVDLAAQVGIPATCDLYKIMVLNSVCMAILYSMQVLSKTTSETLGFYGIPGSAATQTFLYFSWTGSLTC